MRKLSKTSTLAVLSVLVAAVVVLVSPAGASAPGAPTVAGPADGVTVSALPAFAWNAVPGAERYEWEISADAGFNSPVLGASYDHFFTKNTRATMAKLVPNGAYWWHVRAVAADGSVSPWSAARSFTKSWAAAPTLEAPASGEEVTFPSETLRLSWKPVPGAARYLVRIATDPTLGSVVGSSGGVETQATSFTLTRPLAPDQTYYWGITPIDAEGNRGAASAVRSFIWRWPSRATTAVTDVAAQVEIYDHRFSWARVPGAAGYELEVNSSSDFAPGSRVCCPVNGITGLTTIGTSYSPTLVLPNNNRYYWRVRAIDASGNAGVWNVGPEFLKGFDNVLPSVKNLRMADNRFPSEHFETTTPIVTWDPVPGASSYEVEVVPYATGCQWSSRTEHWLTKTSTTAWTPLGSGWNGVKPFQTPLAVGSDLPSLVEGHSYCVRVTALDRPSDLVRPYVRSAETYLPDENTPAFTWTGAPAGGACSPSCNPGAPGSADYLLPLRGEVKRSMPLFRWNPLAGYESYFVIVAKDPEFTNVVDYAFTQISAYAPRAARTPRTYADETTLYYWAVLPATEANGAGVVTAPRFAAPAAFHKQSPPPTLLEPAAGRVFTGAPSFHWTPAHGARRYRLQVSLDPTFSGQVVEDVLTDSTAYTSSETYPADTNLYWRVRADAESGDQPNGVALTWSATGVFRKSLLAPVPSADNATSGDSVPTWRWNVVPGAVSYDFHLEFPDGAARDFRGIPSAAATPTLLKGTGIWHWQVRANFPQVSASSVTPGPWSTRQAFTRTIREPANTGEDVGLSRVLLRWDPKLGAFNYRVQISSRPDFGMLVQPTATTENTGFAPLLTQPAYASGGTFYWRVAAADDATANVGDFSPVRMFTLPSLAGPGGKTASRVSAVVRVRRRTISVTGAVTPNHPGLRVTVVLKRKRGARFVRVAAKRPLLTSASRFATSFRRPRPGTCKLVVRFPGDGDHAPSATTRTVRC
ncbi:MAG: hypothetical protein M3327_02515 [Actinomycetota bacterium]|nr:hypothetical protein [Actinomycetota bacterium]